MEKKNVDYGTSAEIVAFRLGQKEDLPQIEELFRLARERMDQQKIFQWDEIYPAREDFANDIETNTLYTGFLGNQLVAVYVLNTFFDDCYYNENIIWSRPMDATCCIHRLCVHPCVQGKGIGKQTLADAEKTMRSMGFLSVKIDAFKENPISISMYEKNGYVTKGYGEFRKGTFCLMEKDL